MALHSAPHSLHPVARGQRTSSGCMCAVFATLSEHFLSRTTRYRETSRGVDSAIGRTTWPSQFVLDLADDRPNGGSLLLDQIAVWLSARQTCSIGFTASHLVGSAGVGQDAVSHPKQGTECLLEWGR